MTLPDATRRRGPRALEGWAKEERSQTILDAAEGLFLEAGGVLPTVDQVARRAGLAKGTVYLYFPSKELVYLSLLERRLGAWSEDALARLAAVPGPLDASDVVAATLAYPLAEPAVLALACYMSGVLAHSQDDGAATRFKEGRATHLAQVGALVEARLPGVAAGQGVRLFLRGYAFLLGVWQLVDEAPVLRAVVARPGFELFRLDFAAEAEAGLTALWRGALSGPA